MTIFQIRLLGVTGKIKAERWVSVRTQEAALAIARKAIRTSEAAGFELWREHRRILTNDKTDRRRDGRSGGLSPSSGTASKPVLTLPVIAAHSLEQRPEPFDDPSWLFEMKADGFRSLLYLAQGNGRLISRNGREFRRFGSLTDRLARALKVESAILDGDIVVEDPTGRQTLFDLLKRPRDASYVAFDLLWLNGRDLRTLPLIKRKHALRRLLHRRPKMIKEAPYVARRGRALFDAAIRDDLEGIVAKRRTDPYEPRSPWIKIKNPSYSRAKGQGASFNPPKAMER